MKETKAGWKEFIPMMCSNASIHTMNASNNKKVSIRNTGCVVLMANIAGYPTTVFQDFLQIASFLVSSAPAWILMIKKDTGKRSRTANYYLKPFPTLPPLLYG